MMPTQRSIPIELKFDWTKGGRTEVTPRCYMTAQRKLAFSRKEYGRSWLKLVFSH